MQTAMSKFKFPPCQMVADVSFCCSLIYIPMSIFDRVVLGTKVDWADFGMYTLGTLTAFCGMCFSTLGQKYGNAGILTCFENLKVPWQVIIVILASGGQKMPTLMQVVGMIGGVIGAIVIVRTKGK
jgi:hypothetical protein